MINRKYFRPGRLEYLRYDGVEFCADTHSSNGTSFGVDGKPGWIVCAYNDEWSSVPVGRFDTLVAVAVAMEGFVMPHRMGDHVICLDQQGSN